MSRIDAVGRFYRSAGQICALLIPVIACVTHRLASAVSMQNVGSELARDSEVNIASKLASYIVHPWDVVFHKKDRLDPHDADEGS
jgi:hypothetical protein